MKANAIAAVVAIASLAATEPRGVSAQVPASRPDAATIVAGILQAGTSSSWNIYADFDGCPQDDEVGREVLELIEAQELSERITGSLVVAWMDEYHACAYGPLDDWMAQAISDLASADSYYLARVVMDFPSPLHPELAALLLDLAADLATPPGARAELGSAALRPLSGGELVDALMNLLSTPGMPDEWVSGWSVTATQSVGGDYIAALGNNIPSIDDATVAGAYRVIPWAIVEGFLSESDPSLDQLIAGLAARPTLAPMHEHLIAIIEFAGGPVVAPVTADTYLRQGTPNQNQGNEDILSIRASGRHRVLLRADLSGVTGTVASARIEFDIVLNAENWGTSGRTIDAHRMLVAWTELGATWNCTDDMDTTDGGPDCPGATWEMGSLNPPPYDTAPSGSLLVTGTLTGTVSIDVTADVQAMVTGQMTNHGWIIRKTEEGANGRIEIASRETQSGPRLVIELPGQ